MEAVTRTWEVVHEPLVSIEHLIGHGKVVSVRLVRLYPATLHKLKPTLPCQPEREVDGQFGHSEIRLWRMNLLTLVRPY